MEYTVDMQQKTTIESLQKQLLELYHTTVPSKTGLLVTSTAIQQQTDWYNCGLFAIEIAYHLAIGDWIEDSSYCKCRRPDSYDDMCNSCDSWYHFKCARLHPQKAPLADWFCFDCRSE